MPSENKLGSLRLFVCILVGTVLAVFAGVFFTIFHTTMPGMLLEAEKNYMTRQLALVEGLLSSARESVTILAADNAVWEEAYLFAKGENPTFILDNWADKPLLESMHLNLIFFVSEKSEVLYADFEYKKDGKNQTLSPEFKNYLIRLSRGVIDRYEAIPSGTGDNKAYGREGIYLANGTAFSLAAMPIVTVRGAPDASGCLIMGRAIDTAYFHKLTRYESTIFSITPATGQLLTPQESLRLIGPDTVATQASITALDGTPLLLTMTEPRKIYLQGRESIKRALYLMGAALLLFGVLLYQAILRLVLYPTKKVEASLQQRLKQQELMSEMSRSFISSANRTALINNALRMAGEFMGISKILLAQIDKDSQTLRARYEWYTDKEDCYQPTETALPFRPGFPEYDGFIVQKLPYVAHDDISGLEEFRYAYQHGIKSLAGVPVYVFDEFWGMLSFNSCSVPRQWTESDIQLITLIGRVIQGVVERSETEAELVRMSSIVDSSPQFISYMDTEGNFEYINEGTVKALGYTPAEMIAGGIPLFFDENATKRAREELIPRILKEGTLTFEMPVRHKNGSTRIFSFSAFTIVHRKTGIGTLTYDVTEQRLLEKEIIAAKEEAERSSEAKSEFLSRMSHEMRTPLNAIIGMTNIGTSAEELDKKQYCLNKISEASKHLLGVINDILDMSKIAANKFELSYTEFPFTAMIERISNVVAFRVEEKKQTYSVEIDPAIPYAIVSDEQRLAQVIANLLSNAVKFTPENGSITLRALLEEETPSGCVIRVDVTDTGIGIPPEAQKKLFQSFEQADGGISRKFGGTGLGLAISKRIVEMLDGKIWVESEAEKGARFAFTFRAVRGEAEPQATVAAPALSSFQCKALPCFTGRTILLAEDIEVNREIVLTLLEDTEIAIDCAENGAEACEKFRASPDRYAMIFMDIHMPEVDGYEATRRIRAMNDIPEAASIPIIAMTANVFREDVEKCLAAGMNGHIGKPINLDELVAQLSAYCE